MRSLLVLGLLLWTVAARGAEWPIRPGTVQGLIDQAFVSNLALQSEGLALEQALQRLENARSNYQPRVDLVARYTRADGGRTIDIPVGDLLNPVYRTLNDMLVAQGGSTRFSPVSNQSIPLLRGREQETKLRLVQPVYRPEIVQGVKARRAEWLSREAQVQTFKRALRFEVESAYYRLQQAESALQILQSAGELTAEALRTNRVLLENDKITEDRVLRSEADHLAIAQQRAEALRDRNSARAYLNFLLNRPLTSELPVLPATELESIAQATAQLPVLTAMSVEGREELVALHQGIAAAHAVEAAERSALRPKLSLAVEGGTQGENYRVGSGYNFVIGSLVGEMNLWDGRERRREVTIARLERRRLELQFEHTRQQLALQAERANDELQAAVASLQTARLRRQASTRAFDLVRQREREGIATQLSFLDARNELTGSELNFVITENRLLIAAAELDRALARSPLP